MALVLAIEPDLRQAAIVKRIVREKVFADVAVVDSRDAALEAMRTTVPDVLLLSALLSPRDEDELIAHLRTLEDADHLQTHTIPQLASALGPGEGRRSGGLLSAFRRKKEPEAPPSGCDPDMFAEEIRSYLERAAEKKRERLEARTHAAPQDNTWRTAAHAEKAPQPIAEPAAADESTSSSSWSSPFEWKPSNPSALISNPYSRVVSPAEAAEASFAQGLAETQESAPVIAESAPVAAAEPVLMDAAVEQPLHVNDPVHAGTPDYAEVAAHVEAPVDVETPVHADAPVHLEEPVPVAVARSAKRDAGSAKRNAELGIRGQGLRNKDKRLGPLANWLRTEAAPASPSASGDDLRSLLGALAVPNMVAAVGYARGVRIRRVRVPAAREPRLTEPAGAVILSKRLLAEQRELRDQPQA